MTELAPVVGFALWEGWQALNTYCLVKGKETWMLGYMFVVAFVTGWNSF